MNMRDFCFEQARSSILEQWDGAITEEIIKQKLQVDRLSYRIYYSKDQLTRRIFVFRPYCNHFENTAMLELGFRYANPGDTENIPDQPVDQGNEQ